MGALDIIPGVSKLKDIDFMSFFGKIGSIILFLILVFFVACIAGFFLYKRQQKLLYNKKLHWFEEVNGQIIPIEDVLAAELTIPGTSIRVFYIKSKEMYLPRGTKRMGKDSYWYVIRNNREIVNFTLKNINVETGEAGLNYDHTDMRYAHTNLKEIIKRNYKDKATKWWKEYKDVISNVIWIFVMTLSMIFIISQIGKLMGSIKPLLDQAEQILAQIAKLEAARGGLSGSGIAAP